MQTFLYLFSWCLVIGYASARIWYTGKNTLSTAQSECVLLLLRDCRKCTKFGLMEKEAQSTGKVQGMLFAAISSIWVQFLLVVSHYYRFIRANGRWNSLLPHWNSCSISWFPFPAHLPTPNPISFPFHLDFKYEISIVTRELQLKGSSSSLRRLAFIMLCF